MSTRLLLASMRFALIALFAMIGFATVSWAQPPGSEDRPEIRRQRGEGGGRPGGGDRGRSRESRESDGRDSGGRFGGGFGGGFPGGRPGGMDFSRMGGGMDPSLGLLRIPAVQDELNLLDEQKQALGKLGEEMRRRGGNESGPRGGPPEDARRFDFRNATEEERKEFFAKMQAQQKERADKTREQLEELLLPDQLERLEQLALQRRGLMALVDPEIQAELGITAEQITQLQEARGKQESTMRDRLREMMQAGDRDKVREKMAEFRDEMEKQVMEVLTTAQQEKLKEMKGEPFDFGEIEDRGGRRER